MSLQASVIIPCYNSISTIPRTLKSLEKQTVSEFEVVIVDDGSTDGIVKYIEDYKESSDLVIVFLSQKNQGVSVARNQGMNLAKGKYLFFLDADDVYHPLFLEKSIETSEGLQVDSVLAHTSRDVEKVLRGEGVTKIPVEKMDISEYMEYFMYNKEGIHFTGMTYKREILNHYHIRFVTGAKYGEDLEFVWKYLAHCNSGAVLKNQLYGYYDNPGGTIRTVRWEKTNSVDGMIRMEKYLREMNHPFADSFSNYFLPRVVWSTVKTFAAGKREDYYRKFIEEYGIEKYMGRLTKTARNKLLKASAYVFLINQKLFYKAIGVIYKNR